MSEPYQMTTSYSFFFEPYSKEVSNVFFIGLNNFTLNPGKTLDNIGYLDSPLAENAVAACVIGKGIPNGAQGFDMCHRTEGGLTMTKKYYFVGDRDEILSPEQAEEIGIKSSIVSQENPKNPNAHKLIIEQTSRAKTRKLAFLFNRYPEVNFLKKAKEDKIYVVPKEDVFVDRNTGAILFPRKIPYHKHQ